MTFMGFCYTLFLMSSAGLLLAGVVWAFETLQDVEDKKEPPFDWKKEEEKDG